MKEHDLTIHNPTGLHARPAKVFVNTAKQYKSDIRVQHGEKKANAKSLISMLTLGVECGSEIRLIVDGADEEEALAALVTAVADGLGEDHHAPVETAVPPTAPANGQQATPGNTAVLPANVIKGIPAAPGIAIGPIYHLTHEEITIDETFRGASVEEAALQKALDRARGQLVTLHKQMVQSTSASEAAIFEVHQEILEDPDLLDAVLERIHKQQSAARAWQVTIDGRAKAMAALNDPLLAGRDRKSVV